MSGGSGVEVIIVQNAITASSNQVRVRAASTTSPF
jgi:hypothetical protein